MNAKGLLRAELEGLALDSEQIDLICELVDRINRQCDEERKVKQMEGIKKAKESGVALGRPKLQMPENFEELLREWESGNLKADMAARACGMGISTFYRRVRSYKDEKKEIVLNKTDISPN